MRTSILPPTDSLRHTTLDALPDDAVIVDARSSGAHEEERIQGSKNLCVYETDFLEQAKEELTDKEQTVVVYGQNDRYKAATVAADRLSKAGYSNVLVLEGGLDAWTKAEKPTEGEGRKHEKIAGPYRLDVEESTLRWIGRNPTSHHLGEVSLKSGHLQIEKTGDPTNGEVVVDMSSIKCTDISDSKMNRVLVQHLSSEDFFLVDEFPEAKFVAETFERKSDNPGRPNLEISGTMTVRGIEAPVKVTAAQSMQEGKVVLQCNFDLDRTTFGAIYGSATFFERLGMHLVNDFVSLQLTAIFKPRR